MMKRQNENYDKFGGARKKQINRHKDYEENREDAPLSEDVLVTHSDENDPHDG